MFVEIDKRFLAQGGGGLPFVVTTYGKKERDFADRKYGFKHHHLIWVTDGRGSVNINGEKFEISAGEGFFIKSGIPHSYRPIGEKFCTVWLTFTASDAVLNYYSIPDGFRFTVDDTFETLERDLDIECRCGDVLTRSAVGYSWFIQWSGNRRKKTLSIPSQVNRLLGNRFAESISLDEISDAFGIDKFTLCREYKKEYGITVIEHQKLIRIAKAKQLLRFSNEKIEGIARSCGYTSASYFSKVFREVTGVSPKEYRK